MGKAVKSNEYDIRAAVVKELLKCGYSKENIRIEIPLDTASFNGRADIIIWGESWLGCIELKSGKDKFSPDLIVEQCRPYRRVFDKVGVVVDLSQKKDITSNWGSKVDNWDKVNLGYCHETKTFQDRYNWRFTKDKSFDLHCFGYSSGGTCVYDMANILWRDEARRLTGIKSISKSKAVHDFAENKTRKEVRALVIEALKTRPLNKWEEKFWQQFDDEEG